MRVICIASAALAVVGLGGTVDAADLYRGGPRSVSPADYSPIPIANWTGFYVGLNGGGGWGTSDHTTTGTLGGVGVTTSDFDVSGGLFGGTFGYNRQLGQWVVGGEADLDWADINGTQTFTIGKFVGSALTRLDYLDTVRARVGYSWGPSMLYVTGGAAYGSVTAQLSGNVTALAASGFVGQSDTRLGWTIGVGYEYMFTPLLSGKVEYLHVDLGTNTQLLVDNVKFYSEIVRGGLNWHF
jgi:outer membrane immunogenic protein